MQHNFSAGPSILPQPVFKQAAQAVLDFNDSGLSILEISHRSAAFTAVMDEAVELVKELLNLGDKFEVLFLSGGASTQFFMAPMNLLGKEDRAYYIDTGAWSQKAIKEARKVGKIEVLASSEAAGYRYIPKDYIVPADGRYLHVTSNNTIFGTQYRRWPESSCPLVCDMSSDIFSRPLEIERFGLIYAGAQKNLGPAGTTLVVIRRDFLREVDDSLPAMLNYKTHIAKQSMFNTPPVFPIYVSMLNLRWLREQGGVTKMQERNAQKAERMYEAIDNNPCFKGVVEVEDRSHMNATFMLKNPELSDKFLAMCAEADISGIKGHRSVGGFRASMYNAMPVESVEVLIQVMEAFAAKYGE